jgi:hypothetical protein
MHKMLLQMKRLATMPKDARQKLIERIERYLRRTGMSRTAFGRIAAGTPNFMIRLEAGEIKWNTMKKAIDYLDRYEAASISGENIRER